MKKKIKKIVSKKRVIKKDKKLEGRPTKYKIEYCDEMFDFFNIEHTQTVTQTVVDKQGNIKTFSSQIPNQLPTFERFAVNRGVHVDTLNEWTKTHPEFSEAYKKCKNMQKEMLNDLAMRGFYNPAYTQFVAKNITDMKDKTEVDTNNKGETKIIYIDAAEKQGYEDHIKKALEE